MSEPHTVQRCRWAEPTLFQKAPYWIAAEDYPWSCQADGTPRPVADTLVCLTCGRWAARDPQALDQAPPIDARCHCDCGTDCTHR
jgi:hypothetical protein